MKIIYVILLLIFIPLFAKSQDQDTDYYGIQINTGEKPECISCNAKYNYKIDNYLRIDATGSSDVVVKIINSATEECIRCVFINGGSNYEIVNIPEGIYYLKIAYGYDWSKKVSGSFCFAKFMRDVHYQIGNDQLDYFLKDYGSSYDVPSFELVLKVLSNSRKNEFDADNISEEEFYK